MSQRDRLGDATLDLLIADCTLAILGELSKGPTRTSDIEASCEGIAGWTARRRLRSLALHGYAAALGARKAVRGPGRAGAVYSLTELGRDCLLAVSASAAHCEHTWCAPDALLTVPGLWALQLVADRRTRAIARALADGPQRFSDLEVRLPGLTRSALLRRLRTLRSSGVLIREGTDGEVRYALNDDARHLTIIPLRSAHCELQRGTVADKAVRSDLLGRLHVVAPLVRVQHDVNGTCRWHLDSRFPEPDLDIVAAAGRIATLTTPLLEPPQASSHATPELWCEALLHGDPTKLHTTGDHAIVEAVLTGLSAALCA